MIIDFHYHSFPRKLSESAALERAKRLITYFARSAGIRTEKSLSELAQELIIPMAEDPDGAKLLKRMEKAGIDVTVVSYVDVIESGLEEEGILRENRDCADLAKRHPGKIITFAGIDPRRTNAAQIFRRCIEEYGMRGLKWHPEIGFYPTSAEAYEVLRVAQELKVPLLTHTGCLNDWQQSKSRGKFSHPLVLDEVASDFPELKIVAAHTGHLLWRDWCATSYFKRNIYGELSEWQILAVGQYEYFCRSLREIIDISGADRILFGSDGPALEALVSNEQWATIIKDLPKNAPKDIKFTGEEVAAILGGNAQKILGL